MEPVRQLVISLNQLNLNDRQDALKQTENPPHSNPDVSTRKTRFNLVCEGDIIDSDGVANLKFMGEGLQSVPDQAKVNIYNAVKLAISPKKDARTIPQDKMEHIQSVYQRLLQVYGNLFPFCYGSDAHTIYFGVQFPFEKLVSFLKGQIIIDKEIEMIGSGVVTMLGPGFYANQIYSWLGWSQVPSREHAPINDYDFWIQTDSLEKVEKGVIDFLLYSIPGIEYIAAEDLEDFRFLIHELAFKNICSINGQKTIISFSNNCGPDFDITFSKTKMQQPFAFCNGLIIGIPNDFAVHKITAPYVAMGVNPAQCIADQFIGLLNGPTIYNPDKRVNWILSKWTAGRWLFSGPWQEELVKTIHDVTFDPKDPCLAESQFTKMTEAINLCLLMRKLGIKEKASECVQAFSSSLLKHAVNENDAAYHLLYSLFQSFSDPIKGIYYLYLISLYTMPLKKASPVSVETSRNGSFECFSLKIDFKDVSRTIYFSDPFNETIGPLTDGELATVQGWLSYFIQGAAFVPDEALFAPFQKSNAALASYFGCFFACEEALFSKEYPCYEQFFDLDPLAQIMQFPLFTIARINAQFHLRGKPGFDRTERAMQEKDDPLDIARAFILDAMSIAPFAIRKAIPTLIQPSPELLLSDWIEFALLFDKELAASLLRYSAKLPAEKQLSFLQRLLNANSSPLFDEAVCSLISLLVPSTLLQEPPIVLDLVNWVVAHERFDICKNLLGQIDIFKVFNEAVCTNSEANKIPYYFLYRGAFSADDARLVQEDAKALALLPINTTVPCFANALEIALQRGKGKISEILEQAVYEESRLWKRASELQRIESCLTAKSCCHVLNACGPHFVANSDGESLVFWMKTLLDSLKKEKLESLEWLKKQILLDCLQYIKESTIFSHSELSKLLSQEESEQVYAHFLTGLMKRASKVNRPIPKKEAIVLYSKFFPKLALKSPEEEVITSNFIALLCKDIDSVTSFFEIIDDLCHSVLIAKELPDRAQHAIDTLLWCETDVKQPNLEPWKERLFEIACALMHTLLDLPSQGAKQNGIRLELVAKLIGGILRGHPKREQVIPIFEKMVFSALSTCNCNVYKENVQKAKTLYDNFISDSDLLDAYPQHCYKILFVTQRTAWENSPLKDQEKRTLFNEVVDFQIGTKQPLALHIMYNVMLNTSLVLFEKDDAWRMSTIVKIIDAAFAMSQPFESEEQRLDFLKLCTNEQTLQHILKTKRWNDYLSFFFTLLTTSNPKTKRLALLRQFLVALITSDDEKISAVGKKFFAEGVKKDKFRGGLRNDPDLKRLLEPPVSNAPSSSVESCTKAVEELFVLLEKAINSTCPTLKREAITLYNQLLPTLTLKSSEEESVTRLFITLLCKEIDTSGAFLTYIFKLANAVLAQLGHKDLASDGSDVLLWNPDGNFISFSRKTITRHVTLESLLPWKDRFFEIACALMHGLLDAPSRSEDENDVRLDIVAKMIKNMARQNKRAQALAPIFEKMMFSPLSLCNGTVYNTNLRKTHDFYTPQSVFDFYIFDPRSEYKVGLVIGSTKCSDSTLASEVKRALFNEVLDFQISAKQPNALGPMIDFMHKHSLSIFGKDDDAMRIETLWKLINAAFEMPYAKLSVTEAYSLVLCVSNERPLVRSLINCILNDDRQCITYDNADAAKKGYPIVQALIAKLVHLYIEGNDDLFLDALLSLLKQVMRHHLFESEEQYLDLLQSFITSPMVQKIFKTERWNTHITSYFTLLAFDKPQEERCSLFREFIMELLKSNDKRIFEKGKELFTGGMQKGMYRRKIVEDHELMELHKRTFPDFPVEEFLLGCLKKDKKDAAAALKRENVLQHMKTLKDPAILAHKDIHKLFSEQELQIAYANFLEGLFDRAIKANCPEMKAQAVTAYQTFFPKLAIKSPEEQHVTQIAIKLHCEGIDTFSMRKLAASALEAKGFSDLAIYDTNVLLYHPDEPFTSTITKKKVTKHVNIKNLQPLKERFFEIAVELAHALLDAVPKTVEVGHIRLATATSLIRSMIIGKSRDKQLVPLFEKIAFSRLSCTNQQRYIEHLNRVNELHELFSKYTDSYPTTMYKTALLCRRTELAHSSFAFQEKLTLFNEVLDFLISTKQPYALQIICDLMANISTKNLIFERNDALKIAVLEKVIDACLTMPYARAAIFEKTLLIDPSLEMGLKAAGVSFSIESMQDLGNVPLLKCLVDCVVDFQRQLITYDNKDAASKGYPIIKRLTEGLVSLCIKEEGHLGVTIDEFVTIIFTLWQRTWRYSIYESSTQYIDLLQLCTGTPMLKKICTSESWEVFLETYFNLIVWPGSSDDKDLLDLFRQFIMELLKSDDKKIFDKGKALFIEGQQKYMYPGEMTDDPDLMNLFNREIDCISTTL